STSALRGRKGDHGRRSLAGADGARRRPGGAAPRPRFAPGRIFSHPVPKNFFPWRVAEPWNSCPGKPLRGHP
ncbi:hypothetical protein Nmel_014413, partial [Mimus melanotis]